MPQQPPLIRIRTPAAAVAAAAVAVLGLAACGSSGSSTTQPSAPPKSRTLNLSFLQDPGNAATDPAVYYAGQGIVLRGQPGRVRGRRRVRLRLRRGRPDREHRA